MKRLTEHEAKAAYQSGVDSAIASGVESIAHHKGLCAVQDALAEKNKGELAGHFIWIRTATGGYWKQVDDTPPKDTSIISRPFYTTPQPDRTAALCDLAYTNGAKRGWNLGVTGDEKGFAALLETIPNIVKAVKDTRPDVDKLDRTAELEAEVSRLRGILGLAQEAIPRHSKVGEKIAAALAAQKAQEPVPWADVVSAIRAVTSEASRRGEMFPQESEAQSEDRAASRRVCELIKWYANCGGSVAETLEGWPKRYTAPQPDRTAELESEAAQLREYLSMSLPALRMVRKQFPRHPSDDSVDLLELIEYALARRG